MAALSLLPPLDIPDWRQHSRAEGDEYLSWVERIVSNNKHRRGKLNQPPGAVLMITDLSDTIYSQRAEEVNGWGKFYLPHIVKMQVLGVVEGTSCHCDELVLMTCEDKKVYAYDGEELHEVASDLHELCVEGIEYPASKTYYNGEAFKDMTEDDWADVRKGAVGQTLEKEHQDLMKAHKSKFLDYLK